MIILLLFYSMTKTKKKINFNRNNLKVFESPRARDNDTVLELETNHKFHT